MKRIFKRIYDILNEEPTHKHPKLKFIPNIVLKFNRVFNILFNSNLIS